jgi:hypothetical protein
MIIFVDFSLLRQIKLGYNRSYRRNASLIPATLGNMDVENMGVATHALEFIKT